jgi:hypothetical protein
MQIFDKKYVRLAEYLMVVLGTKGVTVYGLPSVSAVYRKLLNKPREEAQVEYTGNRGPFEHQAIHHVRGAVMKYDECRRGATFKNIFRFGQHDEYLTRHKYQANMLYRNALFFLSVCMADIGFWTMKWNMLFSMIQHRQLLHVIASVLGLLFEILFFYIAWILPTRSFWIFAIVLAIRIPTSALVLFFAQHDWESDVSEQVANTNWGYYNAKTSMSLVGENIRWHPLTWGYSGNCPSTLTYHLEHTLFPGVNYLHLSKIASTCEKTCREFNVPYNKINDFTHLNKCFADTCIRGAVAGDGKNDKTL